MKQSAAQNTITITDCQTNEHLASVAVFNASNRIIANTDNEGVFSVRADYSESLKFSLLGYADTIIQINPDKDNYCMIREDAPLKDVAVLAEKIDAKELLIQLQEENIKQFIHEDSTVYYSFRCVLSL